MTTTTETTYGQDAADRLEAAHEAGAVFMVAIDAGRDFAAALGLLSLAHDRGLKVVVTAEVDRK